MAELDGHRILITRPEHQAGPLADAISRAGGHAVRFPALEIVGRDVDTILETTASLAPADIHIFVSPNAVRYGYTDPGAAQVAAIGPGTQAAILDAGGTVDIVSPTGFDSEHLLATDALSAIGGKSIRIFRGQPGRELLGDTLVERGAQVDYVQVYERRAPSHTDDFIRATLADWTSAGMSAWTVMSVETLENFLIAVGEAGMELARQTPLISPSSRVIMDAEKRLPGLRSLRADDVTSDAILAAICAAALQ